MSIQIVSMMPDSALDECEVIKAITKVAIDLAGQRDQLVQKRLPVLDIVFLLPSAQEKVGFVGLRLHSFNIEGQILRIESAVPEKMLSSIHAERFVIAIILDAIDAADEFFREQNILFDSIGHSAMVNFITTTEQLTIH